MITELFIVLFDEGGEDGDRAQRTFTQESNARQFVTDLLGGKSGDDRYGQPDELRKIYRLDTRRDTLEVMEPQLENMKIVLKSKGV